MPRIITEKGTDIETITDETAMAKCLFVEGLSKKNYKAFKRKYAADHFAVQVALDLKKAGLLRSGCLQDFDLLYPEEVSKESAAMAAIKTLVSQNKTLFKIITPSGWNTFLEHMTDYSKRATLRVHADRSSASSKLSHLTGAIHTYSGKRRQKSPEEYQARAFTKKTSTTLLSKHLHTPVFGWHDSRPKVGLLFNEGLCDIRGMLKYDTGTYPRGWVGSEASVERYRDRIRNNLYTDRDKFNQMIDTEPVLNEVLAKLSHKGILGIFVASDRESDLDIARARQKDLEARFQKKYPILIYDYEKKQLNLFKKGTTQSYLKARYDINHLIAAGDKNKEFLIAILSDASEEDLSEMKCSGASLQEQAVSTVLLKIINSGDSQALEKLLKHPISDSLKLVYIRQLVAQAGPTKISEVLRQLITSVTELPADLWNLYQADWDEDLKCLLIDKCKAMNCEDFVLNAIGLAHTKAIKNLLNKYPLWPLNARHLVRAVRCNNIELVQLFLRLGVRANKDTEAAFCYAVRHNDEILKLLLADRATLPKIDRVAFQSSWLHDALINVLPNISITLLSNEDVVISKGAWCLKEAIVRAKYDHQNFEAVKLLLNKGVRVTDAILDEGLTSLVPNDVRIRLIEASRLDDWTPNRLASFGREGNPELLKTLLCKHSMETTQCQSILESATASGRTGMFDYFLEERFDTLDGSKLLQIAVCGGYVEIVRKLQSKNPALVLTKDLLVMAVKNNKAAMIDLFDPTLIQEDKGDLLIDALAFGADDTARALIAKGAILGAGWKRWYHYGHYSTHSVMEKARRDRDAEKEKCQSVFLRLQCEKNKDLNDLILIEKIKAFTEASEKIHLASIYEEMVHAELWSRLNAALEFTLRSNESTVIKDVVIYGEPDSIQYDKNSHRENVRKLCEKGYWLQQENINNANVTIFYTCILGVLAIIAFTAILMSGVVPFSLPMVLVYMLGMPSSVIGIFWCRDELRGPKNIQVVKEIVYEVAETFRNMRQQPEDKAGSRNSV